MSVLYSKVVVVVLFGVAVLMSFSVYDRFIISGEMKEKLEVKRLELDELKLRAQVLDTKVMYLEDERGIEEELRNRFDVAREGEQVVVLLEHDKKEVSNENTGTSTYGYTQGEPSKKKSFFEYIKFW